SCSVGRHESRADTFARNHLSLQVGSFRLRRRPPTQCAPRVTDPRWNGRHAAERLCSFTFQLFMHAKFPQDPSPSHSVVVRPYSCCIPMLSPGKTPLVSSYNFAFEGATNNNR